jgi:hypothetical protein
VAASLLRAGLVTGPVVHPSFWEEVVDCFAILQGGSGGSAGPGQVMGRARLRDRARAQTGSEGRLISMLGELFVLGLDGCFGSSHNTTSSLTVSVLTGSRPAATRK